MARTLSLVALALGSLLLLTSLMVPWLRHEHTFGREHTENTFTLLSETHCSNFARDALECSSRAGQFERAGAETFQVLIAVTFAWVAMAVAAALRERLGLRRMLAALGAVSAVVALGSVANFVRSRAATPVEVLGVGFGFAIAAGVVGIAAALLLAVRADDERLEGPPSPRRIPFRGAAPPE